MRAVLCKQWGDARSLVLEDVAPPPMVAGGVRIRLAVAGVNFADTLIIAGKYQEKPAFPFSPGLEAAGVVIEVAEGVTRCKPGDRVMAILDHGGFAEEAVAREADVFVIPDAMDFATAAGFPIAYGTSHVGLKDRAHLRQGEVLLVHGAAGGVGLTAVEIGRIMGATVIATASGQDKLAICKSYGAQHLIDYSTEDFRAIVKDLTGGRGADVIYDPVGGDTFDTSLRTIAPGGRILIVGFASGRVPQIPANHLLVKNVAAIGYTWGNMRKFVPEIIAESFAELFDWYAKGLLKPLVSQSFALDAVPEALEVLRARKATGKVVIRIA